MEKTKYWWIKAAESGDLNCQYILGARLLDDHKNRFASPKEAFYWLIMAAENGYVGAQCKLGLCYQKGYGGAEIDLEKAKYWYKKATQDMFADSWFFEEMQDAQRALKELEKASKN